MGVAWFVCVDGMACGAYRTERVSRGGGRFRRRRCARLVESVVGSEMCESGHRRGQSRHRWSCVQNWIGNLFEGRLRLRIQIRCFGMACVEREGVVVRLPDRNWARSRIPCRLSQNGMCLTFGMYTWVAWKEHELLPAGIADGCIRYVKKNDFGVIKQSQSCPSPRQRGLGTGTPRPLVQVTDGRE